ncbi:hypothetical protein P691DRAFT_810474, partial [Macrolepiota fuliginosa MF-IS2]
MVSVFPIEIYEIIISHAPDDPVTLNSLSLASVAFVPHSQRRLFGVFRTDRWRHPGQYYPHPNFIKFFDTLLESPHLATYVREFVAPFVPRATQTSADERWVSSMLEALPLMVNLKSFSTFNYIWMPELMLQALVDCPFRLEELQWNWVVRKPEQYQTQLMSTFLSRQTEIHTLSLKMTPIHIPPEALPNLISLATTCENMVAILPGRSSVDTLSCIYIDAADPDFEPMTPESPLVAPFNNIKRLCLGVSAMWLRNMEVYFPSLEVLQTNIEMIRDYQFIAASFPRLRIIHITKAAFTNEQGMMAKWLYSSLPTLECVIWGQSFSGRSPTSQHTYDCWLRSSLPTVLDAQQVHERTGLLFLGRIEPPLASYN